MRTSKRCPGLRDRPRRWSMNGPPEKIARPAASARRVRRAAIESTESGPALTPPTSVALDPKRPLWPAIRAPDDAGLLLAVGSAAAGSVGVLIQQRGAVAASTVLARHRLRSAINLFGSKWWTMGWLIAVCAWLPHVGALSLASLSIVQGVISAGLVVLALVAERRRRAKSADTHSPIPRADGVWLAARPTTSVTVNRRRDRQFRRCEHRLSDVRCQPRRKTGGQPHAPPRKPKGCPSS